MLTQIFLIVMGYLDGVELLVSGYVCVRLLDDDPAKNDKFPRSERPSSRQNEIQNLTL